MNTAIAISGGALRSAQLPSKPSRLRLLPTAYTSEPLLRTAQAQRRIDPPVRRETLLLALLALVVHVGVAWAVLNRTDAPRLPKFSQEMELLKPPPEVKPEPPKPVPPPPKKIEPPKAVEPPKPTPTPPQALRTAPAEAPQPNTLTVAENLTATKTTGPVVAAPPAPPAPKIEEPITEANGSAAYLNNPPPAYPKAAQRLGMQGRVVLRVQVLASGHVGAIEVKQSSGKTLLDEAALTAVKTWGFTPAKRGSTPIDGWTNVPIEFRIAP
jgi:protein TonB